MSCGQTRFDASSFAPCSLIRFEQFAPHPPVNLFDFPVADVGPTQHPWNIKPAVLASLSGHLIVGRDWYLLVASVMSHLDSQFRTYINAMTTESLRKSRRSQFDQLAKRRNCSSSGIDIKGGRHRCPRAVVVLSSPSPISSRSSVLLKQRHSLSRQIRSNPKQILPMRLPRILEPSVAGAVEAPEQRVQLFQLVLQKTCRVPCRGGRCVRGCRLCCAGHNSFRHHGRAACEAAGLR